MNLSNIYVQNNVPLACYNINVVSESFFGGTYERTVKNNNPVQIVYNRWWLEPSILNIISHESHPFKRVSFFRATTTYSVDTS